MDQFGPRRHRGILFRLIPGLGRSPREGKGHPLQYSGLENSMDCTDRGGHKESDMIEWLSLSFAFLRKEMAKLVTWYLFPFFLSGRQTSECFLSKLCNKIFGHFCCIWTKFVCLFKSYALICTCIPIKDFVKLWTWLSALESGVYEEVIVKNPLVKPWSFEHFEKYFQESACNAGDLGSIPGSVRSPGEEKAHSSILAWKIPWTEKPGGL